MRIKSIKTVLIHIDPYSTSAYFCPFWTPPTHLIRRCQIFWQINPPIFFSKPNAKKYSKNLFHSGLLSTWSTLLRPFLGPKKKKSGSKCSVRIARRLQGRKDGKWGWPQLRKAYKFTFGYVKLHSGNRPMLFDDIV